MQSGSGIQELMAAETRASQIVAEARIGEWLFVLLLLDDWEVVQLGFHPVIRCVCRANQL
jgi:hypothetical protein